MTSSHRCRSKRFLSSVILFALAAGGAVSLAPAAWAAKLDANISRVGSPEQLGSTYVRPGAANLPLLAFTLASASPTDRLRVVRVTWNGSGPNPSADIGLVKIYRESGAISGSSFSMADTQLAAVVPPSANDLRLDVPDYAFTQTKLYLVVDLKPAAVAGRTVDFRIEPNKLVFTNGTFPSGPDVGSGVWNPAGASTVNTAPTVVNGSAHTDEDTSVDLIIEGRDADGQALTLSTVTTPSNGSLVVTPGVSCSGSPSSCTKSVRYTPDEDFFGNDAFTFQSSDGLQSSVTATVNLAVGAVNDFPVALADDAQTDEDTVVFVSPLANDDDVDGDPLTIGAVDEQSAAGGSVVCAATCTYTPTTDFYGVDTFSYTATDGEGSSTALVTVTVSPVNDAPVVQDDAYTSAEGSSLVVTDPETTDPGSATPSGVLDNDSDLDSAMTAVLDSGVTQGTLAFASDGTFTYTPPSPDFYGVVTFTYHATDGSRSSPSATVTITVTPVNDQPQCSGLAIATDEDTPALALPVCSDADLDALTYSIVTPPAHGTASIESGNLRYVPSPNYNGSDGFVYRASDGIIDSDVATATVTVTPVADAPNAVDDHFALPHGAGLTTLDVRANDMVSADTGLPFTVLAITSAPSSGLASVAVGGTGVTYTPLPGSTGPDSFQYSIIDTAGETDIATVTTDIRPAVISVTTPTSLGGPSRVVFSEPVTPLGAATFNLKITGTSSLLSASMACTSVTGTTVPCATGAVKSATLSRTLVAGQRYTVTVGGAIADLASNALTTSPVTRSFRASRLEQELSLGGTAAWRPVTASGALGRSYRTERLAGASARFVFTGTNIVWYTVTGPSQGLARVYIDGVLRKTMNNYSSSVRYRVPRAWAGLTAKTHEFKIVVSGARGSTAGTGTFVSVDAFKVGSTLSSTPAAKYTWQRTLLAGASGGAYARANLAGAAQSFVFRGTGIRWYTVMGPAMGKARVYIDGVLRATVDNYAPTGRVAYRAYGGLSDAVHTVRIVALGTKRAASSGTMVALDRWYVI